MGPVSLEEDLRSARALHVHRSSCSQLCPWSHDCQTCSEWRSSDSTALPVSHQGCGNKGQVDVLESAHCIGDRDQDHPHGKEIQKSKMAVWGGLTNSWEKKRSEKPRRKERYKHLNAEFQRITRRDKKVFLSDQCIEENNRMGKTRDLFKKIIDTKGTFHAKMGTIKERNGMI